MIFLPGYCLHLRLISPLSSPEERSQQNLKTESRQIKYVIKYLLLKLDFRWGLQYRSTSPFLFTANTNVSISCKLYVLMGSI